MKSPLAEIKKEIPGNKRCCRALLNFRTFMGHDGLLSADKAGETGRRLWSVARLEGAKQIYGELFQTKKK